MPRWSTPKRAELVIVYLYVYRRQVEQNCPVTGLVYVFFFRPTMPTAGAPMTEDKPMPRRAAVSEMRDAMKAVPSLGVLIALWFMALRYAFDQWRLLAALSTWEHGYLASIVAVPFALITYYLANYWDDRVFGPLYTEDPSRNFRGEWLDTSRRNCLGLLPAGRDLDQARKKAAEILKLPSVEGVYATAKTKLQGTKQWATVGRLLFLSKLCAGV